jgi:hypothetical protein
MTWPWFLVDRIIPAGVADAFRFVSIIGSLVLLVAACYAVAVSRYSDQRVRFGLFAVFSVMLTAGTLDGLGHPAVWRLGILPPLVALAVWSTVRYVRRELGERRHGQ